MTMTFPRTGLPGAPRFRRPLTPRSEPLRIVGPTDHAQTKPRFVGPAMNPQAEWIECPLCEKMFTSAAVVTDAPHVSETAGGLVVCRKMYCDHCDMVFAWEQSSNADGSKLGDRDRRFPPGMMKARADVDKFLRDHPEAAGVLQS